MARAEVDAGTYDKVVLPKGGPRTSDRRFLAVLDACVLVEAPLRDTLLRLAEPPRLYVPLWSDEIVVETVRTLESWIGLSAQKTAYLVSQLGQHFVDAWVPGYEPLVEQMTNHPKDRYVLASAVKSGATVIVTYSKRHCRPPLQRRGESRPKVQALSLSIRTTSTRRCT